MDVLDNHHQHLYKTRINAKTGVANTGDRRDNMKVIRRRTRTDLAFTNRNINENSTPIKSPNPQNKKRTEEAKNNAGTNKRLDMLAKWKLEKEKLKAQQKKNAKPLFKVCHVSNKHGFPNLDNVEIKGVPIRKTSTFAPENHKFRPPVNVKPVHIQKVNTENKKIVRKPSKEVVKLVKTPKKQDSNNKQNAAQKIAPKVVNDVKSAESHVKKNTVTRTFTRTKPDDIKVQNERKTATDRKPENLRIRSETKIIICKKPDDIKVPNETKTPTRKKPDVIHFPNQTKIPRSVIKRQDKIKKSNENNEQTRDIVKKVVLKTPRKSVSDTPIRKKWKIPKTPKFNAVLNVSSSDDDEGLNDTNYAKTDNIPIKFSESQLHDQQNDSVRTTYTTMFSPDYPIDDINILTSTPNEPKSPSAYISPFVTVSRGKHSARREFQIRNSVGTNLFDSPELVMGFNKTTSPKAGAAYFTKKLNNEIFRIEGMCTEWVNYKANNDLPGEAIDMIDVCIGQSKLLITKKCKQFQTLIEQCGNSVYSEKPVTCLDLHGFWDMIYMQVEDVDKRFDNLIRIKNNNWQEVVVLERKRSKAVQKQKGRPAKTKKVTSKIKDMIKAARYKNSFKETRLLDLPKPDQKLFDGGYFTVTSPVVKSMNTPSKFSTPPKSARKSLRVSVINSQTKRVSAAGLTVMKISQAIKSGHVLTPAKSILKTDLTKSAGRSTKSVLFIEHVESDHEDNKETSIKDTCSTDFSPWSTPIRSSFKLKLKNVNS